MTQAIPKNVEAAFATISEPERGHLLALRAHILKTAVGLDDVGTVEEVLRWGQPSYIAKRGTALRLAAVKGGGYGIYTHCQSGVIARFAASTPRSDQFEIEGNRAVRFERDTPPDLDALHSLIVHALRYKDDK